MFPYDPALLGAVSSTPQSIAEVVAILEAIEEICEDGDGLKWFNWLYLQVTLAVKARVETSGFLNPPWMAELDVAFAGYYFAAIRAALGSGSAPGCWQAFFDRRNQSAVARIQFALAGMNAHINHDLPQAVLGISDKYKSEPLHGTPQYRDYTALDTTLGSLVDQAKTTLHARLLGDSLPPVSHLDDTLAAWSLAAARETAWNNAAVLWHLQPLPEVCAAFLASLNGFTTLAGATLLVPVP